MAPGGALFEEESNMSVESASMVTITSLPPEILSVVFLMGAHDGSSPEESTKLALRISHVCREFRAISLGLSSLWTCIDLMWEPDRRQEWLARSGAKPLHIYLHQSHVVPEHWDWSALVHESARWASADIHMADEARLVEVIDVIMSLENLFILESLSLGNGNDPPTRFDLGEVMPNLPALRSLTTEYLQLDHVERIAGRLTSLSVTGVEYTASEWIPMLQAAPDLESLGVYGDVDPDHPLTDIGLPRLRQLQISWGEEGALGFIFRTIQSPSLESLSIEIAQSPRNRDSYIPPMQKFVSDYAFKQRENKDFLCKRCFNVFLQLHNTPELTHLTITDDYDPDEDQCSLHILDILSNRFEDDPENPIILPALDHLFLSTDSPYLRAFIEFRLAHLPPHISNNRKVLTTLGLNRCSTENERIWLAQWVDTLVIDSERICVRPQWVHI